MYPYAKRLTSVFTLSGILSVSFSSLAWAVTPINSTTGGLSPIVQGTGNNVSLTQNNQKRTTIIHNHGVLKASYERAVQKWEQSNGSLLKEKDVRIAEKNDQIKRQVDDLTEKTRQIGELRQDKQELQEQVKQSLMAQIQALPNSELKKNLEKAIEKKNYDDVYRLISQQEKKFEETGIPQAFKAYEKYTAELKLAEARAYSATGKYKQAIPS